MDTDISVIIDMSGSMGPLTSDTIGGFNAWLEEVQKGKKTGKVKVTVTTFDTLVEQHVKGVDVKDVPLLGSTENPYQPRGGTALLDAVGKTLSTADRRVTKDKRGLAVIITDGWENASHEWNQAKLGKLMAKLEKSGRWSFLYLGAGVDSWDQAKTYNSQALQGQTISVDRHQILNTMRAAGQTTSAYTGGIGARAENMGLPTMANLQKIEADAKVKSK